MKMCMTAQDNLDSTMQASIMDFLFTRLLAFICEKLPDNFLFFTKVLHIHMQCNVDCVHVDIMCVVKFSIEFYK